MSEDTKPPRFWRVGNEWRCAVPARDPFAHMNIPGRGKDWWKRFGLIGRGKTRKEALDDLEVWQRCSDLVAQIY